MKRHLLAAALLASSLTVAHDATNVAALSQCSIVSGASYTSTRCDGDNGFLLQRAKHVCHTAEGTFSQYGYYVGARRVSSAGYCDGYITNRGIIQS